MREEEREIDLIDLISHLISKWFWILLVGVLVGAGVFALTSFVIQPKYDAVTTLIVGNRKETSSANANLEYNEVITNQKLVETYSQIMKSRSIAERVIDNLDLEMDLEEFSKKITVQPVKDTEVFSLTVEDTIPERARDIANETAEIFRGSIESIMNVDNVQILDPATAPDEQSSPQVIKLTILGFIGGAFVMVLIFAIAYIVDDRVKGPDQVQEELGITVLGTIPKVKKGEELSYGKKD